MENLWNIYEMIIGFRENLLATMVFYMFLPLNMRFPVMVPLNQSNDYRNGGYDKHSQWVAESFNHPLVISVTNVGVFYGHSWES